VSLLVIGSNQWQHRTFLCSAVKDIYTSDKKSNKKLAFYLVRLGLYVNTGCPVCLSDFIVLLSKHNKEKQ